MIFCTLFDSNYLDKGIVMYNSLSKLGINFKLYVLAMDAKCHEVLSDLRMSGTEIISLQEIINARPELEQARNNRSQGEFCWTCTPYIIDYVLSVRGEKICTYIDSDLYFYSDPSVLIAEMRSKTVQIVEHRLTESYPDMLTRRASGTYCVQFNTFKNTADALELLRWWRDSCFERCTSDTGGKALSLGDQGYLEHWGELDNVSVLQNLGGGVAPWNVAQYRLTEDSANGIILEEKRTHKKFTLIFYHFHYILHVSPDTVNICVYVRHWGTDEKLIRRLYIPYLRELDDAKNMLKAKYGIYPILYEHPGLKKPAREKPGFIVSLAGKLLRIWDHPFHKVFYKVSGKLLRRTQRRRDIMKVNNNE